MKSIYETNLFKDQLQNTTGVKRSTGGPFMASPIKKGKKAAHPNKDDIVDSLNEESMIDTKSPNPKKLP